MARGPADLDVRRSAATASPGVLMLVENHYPADTRVRNEAVTLASNGLRVFIVCLRGKAQTSTEVIDGVTVFRLPQLTLFDKLPEETRSWPRRLLRKVTAVLGYVAEYAYFTSACLVMSTFIALRYGFQIVHVHNPPDTLVIVSAWLKLLGKKSVFDHHDLSPELYLSRYKTNESAVTWALRILERLSVRLADVVIATNESYRRIDVERNGAEGSRVFVVRNGPDLRRVTLVERDPALASRGKIILGYVGAMNPQDGLDYLLRALSHLVHSLGRTDFYCVLIGSGDSLDALRRQAADDGLEEYLHFTGFIPDSDMIRYLSSADICLDPNPSSPLNDVSTWIKVMEYMALAKPVVSFDLKETRVSAGEAAIYVKPNDEAAFAAAISELMDDPDRRRQMGEWGRKRVHEALSWDVSSRNLLNAYRSLFTGKLVKELRPVP